MNLKQFQDLCRDEWKDRKGDVRQLWLLEDSYRELQEDAKKYRNLGETDIYFDEDDAKTMAAVNKVSLKVLINPYTRTVVKMRLARDTDVADVWYGDVYYETRFLDLDKARELGIRV